MKELGIVGFGSFGQFIAARLSGYFRIFAYNPSDKSREAERLGVRLTDFNTAVSRDIVILSMPMNKLESVLIRMKGKIKKDALVMDICSLKVFSEKLMKKYLKNEPVKIVGTHPLFGPLSAGKNLSGCKIALCKIRAKDETVDKIKRFCEQLGLKVYLTTAREHDKQMAVTQALTHFIAKSINKAGLTRPEMTTKTGDMLFSIAEIVKKTSPALFYDLQTISKDAGKVRKRFMNSAIELDKSLKKQVKRKV